MENFEVIKTIGRGNFGEVQLVRLQINEKLYVNKKISMEELSEEEKKGALNEVKLLQQLKHPFIVTYKDSYLDEKNLHIIMHYCEGGDLTARIKAQNGVHFELEQVLDWFIQLALALQFCHQKKILHRDIKSQNVFLTKRNGVRLGDFGIARVLNGTNEMAMSVVGTPFSMSPEVCASKPYSFKSDIWALGCVLYEVCVLKHAFDSNNLLGLVWKIVQENYPPVPDVYPPELRNLISDMLNKDPHKRPSIDEILDRDFIKEGVHQYRKRMLNQINRKEDRKKQRRRKSKSRKSGSQSARPKKTNSKSPNAKPDARADPRADIVDNDRQREFLDRPDNQMVSRANSVLLSPSDEMRERKRKKADQRGQNLQQASRQALAARQQARERSLKEFRVTGKLSHLPTISSPTSCIHVSPDPIPDPSMPSLPQPRRYHGAVRQSRSAGRARKPIAKATNKATNSARNGGRRPNTSDQFHARRHEEVPDYDMDEFQGAEGGGYVNSWDNTPLPTVKPFLQSPIPTTPSTPLMSPGPGSRPTTSWDPDRWDDRDRSPSSGSQRPFPASSPSHVSRPYKTPKPGRRSTWEDRPIHTASVSFADQLELALRREQEEMEKTRRQKSGSRLAKPSRRNAVKKDETDKGKDKAKPLDGPLVREEALATAAETYEYSAAPSQVKSGAARQGRSAQKKVQVRQSINGKALDDYDADEFEEFDQQYEADFDDFEDFEDFGVEDGPVDNAPDEEEQAIIGVLQHADTPEKVSNSRPASRRNSAGRERTKTSNSLATSMNNLSLRAVSPHAPPVSMSRRAEIIKIQCLREMSEARFNEIYSFFQRQYSSDASADVGTIRAALQQQFGNVPQNLIIKVESCVLINTIKLGLS